MVPVVPEAGFELMSCVSIASLPSLAPCSVDESAGAGAVITCTLMDVFKRNQFAFDSAIGSAVTLGA
jgi:hypothetical protein